MTPDRNAAETGPNATWRRFPSATDVDFEDELDRLRMMRVAEDGLAVGDHLPDFALADGAGRIWTSQRAARSRAAGAGPVPRRLVSLLRPHHGGAGRGAAGDRGAGRVGRRHHARACRARRRDGAPARPSTILLLSDPANRFARTCGLAYELSPGHIRIHRERGRDFPRLHGDTTWRLPIPAVFVVEPDARVAFAFSDVDPARWPDPEELLASLADLRDAHALSKR